LVAETIARKTINGFRYYEVRAESSVIGIYPSVTSVLGRTSDSEWLTEWQNRIGQKKAAMISEDSVNRGTVMHRLSEIYCSLPIEMPAYDRLQETLSISRLDEEIDKFDNRAKIVGGALFFNYYRAGLFNEIRKVIAQEKFLWTGRDGGYAGTLDNLSELVTDEISLIDFKTAKKPKDESWIEDYKIQVSAYAVAVWDRLRIKVSNCKIWISNEASHVPQCFVMQPRDIREYYLIFADRLKKFYELHPPIVSQ